MVKEMSKKLDDLLEYVCSEGRVCPMPIKWKELWDKLPNKKRNDVGGWDPNLPLILSVWWEVPSLPKTLRLQEHIEYANEHGVLDEIDEFIRNLDKNDWAYGDGTSSYIDYNRNL